MTTAFNYADSIPNFDETDFFLSTLLSTVPSLDKNDPYNFGFSDLATADLGDIVSNKHTQTSEPPSLDQSPASQSNTNDSASEASYNNMPPPVRLSVSSASYADLVTSNNSTENTPNTSLLSPHTLPEGLSELGANYKSMFSSSFIKKEPSQDTLNSDNVLSPKTKANTKEKASAKDKISKPGKKTKVSHNMIEKKYRTNINTKIFELRDAVPTLRVASGRNGMLLSELEGLAPASKLNKASVLTKATEYIKHLEKKNDSMLNQIASLQQLINNASVDPSICQSQQQSQPKLQPQPQPQPRIQQMAAQPLQIPTQNPSSLQQAPVSANNFGGFGFMPNDQSFNTTVNDFDLQTSDISMPPQSGMNYDDQQFSSNWLMGGLATFMGSSMMTEDNFRGLAAVPFVPSFITHPSATTLQVLSIFRVALFAYGIYHFVAPFVAFFGKPKDEKTATRTKSVYLTWISTFLGLQVPRSLLPTAKSVIFSHILDGNASGLDLFRDYLVVSSSEVNFENCFLTLLVGALLCRKFPALSKLTRTNFKYKGSLLSNLEYNGDEPSLKRLNKLVKSSDGSSLFSSTNLIQRLINVADGKTVIADVSSGENHLAYVEIFRENKRDVYGLVFNWRLMEIIYELNLAYLNLLVVGDEEKEKTEAAIRADIEHIGHLLDEDTNAVLLQYYMSLKCLLSPDATPLLMESMKAHIVEKVNRVNLYFDGQDLTDDEMISDSEDLASVAESDTEADGDNANNGKKDVNELIRNLKSMIYSMNLMNEEKFIVLTSSLMFFYKKIGEEDKLRHLLQRLQFNTSRIPLSLLAFTCLVKVVCSLVKEEDERSNPGEVSEGESLVLESLVKLVRKWLNEDYRKQFMDQNTRSLLADLILSKGMMLNNM